MGKMEKILAVLINENPDLPIKVMTHCEVFDDRNVLWHEGKIELVEKDIYWDESGELKIGEEKIKNYFLNNLEKDPNMAPRPHLEKVKFVSEDFDSINFKSAIFVYVALD